MAFAKDQWTRPVTRPDGSVERVRNDKRWGRGKRWLGVWLDPNGKEKTKAFETKAEALRYARTLETDRDRGDYLDPNAGKTRLDEIGARWIASRSVDPSSQLKYESIWRLHVQPRFGARQVKSVRTSEIAVWLKEVASAYGSSTARSALTVLSGCLELAGADELIRKNPARSKQVKRPQVVLNRSSVWPDETVAAIISRHPPRYRLIPIIGAGAGLRQGELFGLSAEDFDFKRGLILVRRQLKRLGTHQVFALPKNEKEREVPMSSSVAAAVQHHLEDFGTTPISLPWKTLEGDLQTIELMLTWTDNRQIRARSYDDQIWKPALAAAGVIPPPIRDRRHRKLRYRTDRMAGVHALRHYFASVALADGVNIKELAEYLGHHDAAFTLRQYTHLLVSSHERARLAIDRRLSAIISQAHGAGTELRPMTSGAPDLLEAEPESPSLL